MGIAFLYAVEILSSVLLIGVILLQQSKGGGLGGGFGAAMGESVFGSQANRALIKFTVWTGCIFVITTLMIARHTSPVGSTGGDGGAVFGVEESVAPTFQPTIPEGLGTPGTSDGGAPTFTPSPAVEPLPSSPITTEPAVGGTL